MFQEKKDFETIGTSLSKSNNSNDVVDTPTSKDNNSVSQINENLNEEIKDFYTFDERTPKEIEWLWKPYIVKGNLNIIMGDGGIRYTVLMGILRVCMALISLCFGCFSFGSCASSLIRCALTDAFRKEGKTDTTLLKAPFIRLL